MFPQNSITILACACDTTGSKSEVCDKSSGKCDCNDNVVGDKCTQCSTEHWGFPSCQSGYHFYHHLLYYIRKYV